MTTYTVTDCAHMGAVPYESASAEDKKGMQSGQWRCKDDGLWREPEPVPPCNQIFQDEQAWQQAIEVHTAAHGAFNALTKQSLYGSPLDQIHRQQAVTLLLQLIRVREIKTGKVCISCDEPQGNPHKPDCVTQTGTLRKETKS